MAVFGQHLSVAWIRKPTFGRPLNSERCPMVYASNSAIAVIGPVEALRQVCVGLLTLSASSHYDSQYTSDFGQLAAAWNLSMTARSQHR